MSVLDVLDPDTPHSIRRADVRVLRAALKKISQWRRRYHIPNAHKLTEGRIRRRLKKLKEMGCVP